MKYILPISIVIILIVIIASVFVSLESVQQMTVVREGNLKQQPLEMIQGRFQCSQCGMIINDLSFASQVAAADGKTWFFDDHGCMAAWLVARRFEKAPRIWVPDLETGVWIDGRQAWYSRTDNTPMSSGFGAYSVRKEGFINFSTMQSYRMKGETLSNPLVKKQLLGE